MTCTYDTAFIGPTTHQGFGNFWSTPITPDAGRAWTQLRNLNLSHCGLSTLPSTIGDISALHILRLSYNKLASLPSELSALGSLEVLAADHNLLVSIPGGHLNESLWDFGSWASLIL